MQNATPTKSLCSQKSKTKSRVSKRQRNRRRNKQKSLNSNQNKAYFPNTPDTQSGADIWRNAYENAVRWHGEHQSNYWRRAADALRMENQMLRQQLHQNRLGRGPPDQTSDDGEDVPKKLIAVKKEELQDDEIDVKYLEFLQITAKHREELRLKRQAEAQEPADCNPPEVKIPLLG